MTPFSTSDRKGFSSLCDILKKTCVCKDFHMSTSRQLSALVRKNFILKRRSKCSTLCELLFPLIIAAALVIPKQLAVGKPSEYAEINLTDGSYPIDIHAPYSPCIIDSGDVDNPIPASFAIVPGSLGDDFKNYHGLWSYEQWPIPTLYYDTEEELEASLLDPSYPNGGPGGSANGLCGAIVFNDDGATYKIRLNGTWNHDGWNFYRYQGFLTLMRLADGFLYEKQFGPVASVTNTFFMGMWASPQINVGSTNEFLKLVGAILCNPLFIVFSVSVARLVSLVAGERESKGRELMRMMGLKERHFYLSWIVTYIVIYLCVAVGISCILKFGGVLPKTDLALLILLFFLFGLSSASFGLFISAPFDTTRTASMTAMAVYFFASYLNVVVRDNQSIGSKIAISLLPQCALQLGMTALTNAEINDSGMQFSEISRIDSLYQMSWILGMLAIDAVGYFLAYVYLDLVLPHKFGVRLPWNFFLKPSFWTGARSAQAGEFRTTSPTASSETSTVIEPFGPRELQLLAAHQCVETINLRKTFTEDGAEVRAVDGVSLAMFQSEIFCLLGHNGAGKSTLIAMLSGLLEISSGSASIFNKNVATQLSEIRKSMGLCPQHDILWDDLTVSEHMKLFSALRGVSSFGGEALIAEVGLTAKSSVRAGALSGGMKRRLSIAISFVGKGDFVVLDEPTAGLDPYARRSVWDLLKRKKEGRVLCLCTHFMDEAELLGDRVAIMSAGQVRAYGSSLFLKSAFQCGYELTFVKEAAADDLKIVAKVKETLGAAFGETRTISGAASPRSLLTAGSSIEIASSSPTELVVQVPPSVAPGFKSLFTQIEGEKQKLGVKGYGITSTKLEDVFMKVASAAHKKIDNEASPLGRQGTANSTFGQPLPPGWALWRAQLQAETQKRIYQARRDGKLFICFFLLPVLLVTTGLGLSFVGKLTDIDAYEVSTLPGVPEFAYSYDPPYSTWGEDFATAGKDLGLWTNKYVSADSTTPSGHSGEIGTCGESWPRTPYACNEWWNFAEATYNGSAAATSRLGAFFVDSQIYEPWKPRVTLFANVTESSDALPQMVAAANTAGMRSFFYPGVSLGDFKTTVINHPMPLTYSQKAGQQFGPQNNASVYMVIGFAFIAAGIAMALAKERQGGVKEQQMISGMYPTAYWLAKFFTDLLLYLPIACVFVLLFLGFDIHRYLLDTGCLVGIAAVVFAFGPVLITFTYAMSFFLKTVGVAQAGTLAINNIAGIAFMIVSNVMRLPSLGQSANDVEKILRWIFRLIPMFGFGDSIYNILVSRSATPVPSVWDDDVTLLNLQSFAVLFVFYGMLTLYFEFHENGSENKIPGCCKRRKYESVQGEDDAVIEEKTRVKGLVKMGASRPGSAKDSQPLLILDGVEKWFGAFHAVKGISLACNPGEVFGLLGLNGAGKTTAMRMAVGQLAGSAGSIFVAGINVMKNPEIARRHIGYCPQSDALTDELTVREHLLLFAKLRGLSDHAGVAECERLSRLLDLFKFRETRAGSLSGGNKRKLSVALALVGDPAVVFLDEPSSGLDPLAMRHMWSVVESVARDKHRVIVITTHSMEEAEALSSKIAIMASGRFRCLGSVQELKNRYGKGFELAVRVKVPLEVEINGLINQWGVDRNVSLSKVDCLKFCAGAGRVELFEKELGAGSECFAPPAFAEWWLQSSAIAKVCDFALQSLPGTVSLLEGVGRVQKFLVKDCPSVLELFEAVETFKSRGQLDEYSVSQFSLEQIFNGFAKDDQIAMGKALLQ